MKKILLTLLLITSLASCDTNEHGGNAENGRVTILRKEQGADRFNIPWYQLYIFNGTNSKWYFTNLQTYNMYKVGDTINTLIFTDR